MTDATSPDTLPSHESTADLPASYDRWRTKFHKWIAQRSRGDVADAILLLPDLLALVVRLIRDPNTPLFFKSQLLLVAGYILLPIDIIPEAVLGAAGLADDVVVVSLMLMRILQSANDLPKELIQKHWAGKGNITDTLQDVVENQGELINTKVWKAIRSLFGDPSPEPAMVDNSPSQDSHQSGNPY